MAAAEGGCQCGAIRYRFDAGTGRAGICHCRSCRRSTGAPSVAWVTVPAAALAVTRGAAVQYASSPGVRRGFCGRCGTSLFYRADGEDSVDVTVASLDDPEAVPPRKEVWLSHRLSWEAVESGRPGFAEGSAG